VSILDYSAKSKESLEKSNWRYARVNTLESFIGIVPDGDFIIEMPADMTVIGEDGKRILDPKSFVVRAVKLGLVKPEQIICVDLDEADKKKGKRQGWNTHNNKIGCRNSSTKNVDYTKIRHEIGYLHKVVAKLVKQGVSICYINADLMCMPVTVEISNQIGGMMDTLRNQAIPCVLELNLCVRNPMQSPLSYESLYYLKGMKVADWTKEYKNHSTKKVTVTETGISKRSIFNRALDNRSPRPANWNYVDAPVWHTLKNRYFSNRLEMETSIFVKEINPDFVEKKVKVIKVSKTKGALSPQQRAWITRKERENKEANA